MAENQPTWSLHGRLVKNGELCRIAVEALPFLIGRRTDLALTLRSDGVSKTHAEVTERDGRLWVRDLDSKNGTFVNGRRINGEVPLCVDDLLQFADMPFRVTQAGDAFETVNTDATDNEQEALALVQLATLLENHDIQPLYQPIVDLSNGNIVAYEALARSRLVGLRTPQAIFSAASRLGVEADVSRVMRIRAIQCSSAGGHLPHLFVNTDPTELAAPDFHDRVLEMRALSPFQRLTLEIHEAALTDVAMLLDLQSLLKELEIDLVFDDFGIGQARIAELAAVNPKCVKFDRSLIAAIDSDPGDRVNAIGCLVRAMLEMRVTPLAEGVETVGEADVCRELGFQLAQGFYFGRPAPLKYQLTELAAPL